MLRSFAVVLLCVSATSLAEPNIGVVDLNRAFESSTEGQAVIRQLKALSASKTLTNEEYGRREREALEPIKAKLNAAAARLGAEHGLVAVLDRSVAVLTSLPSIDFTNELISRVEKPGSTRLADAPRAEPSVGFVDVQRIFEATTDGRAAKKRLKRMGELKTREFEAEKERLLAQKRELEASGESTQGLAQSVAALQSLGSASSKELADAERAEIGKLAVKLDPLIVAVAAETGTAFIFDVRVGVVWFDPRRDFTDELIRRFDGQPAKPLQKVGDATTIRYVDTSKLPADANFRRLAERLIISGEADLVLDKVDSNLVYARASLERTSVLTGSTSTPVPAPTAPAPQALPTPPSDDDAIDKAPITRMRQRDAYAVVIGVENYRGQLPPADHAEHDAAVFSRYLVRTLGVPPENVKTLVGQGASKSDIEAALAEWLPATKAGPGATVYFYFSGHGAPDPTTGDSYLVPWDGDPAFLKTKALRVSEVYSKLTALKGRRVLALLDACFSGTGARSVLPKGVRPLVVLKPVETPKGVFASLTASGAAETSGPATTSSHGLFTEQVLRGLSGLADRDGDHVVSLHELNLFVTRQVKDLARAQGREQTPTLSLSGVRAAGEWSVVDGLVDE